jgi:hypothetical protein
MGSQTKEIAMRKSPNNQVALDAFIARKAEIDTMLERPDGTERRPLQRQPRRDQLGPRGTLTHDAELLKRITGAAFKEGEHAL